MLQINAPALSQFTRGPRSLQNTPVPGKTKNAVDIAKTPVEGTEAVTTQRLEGTINHTSDSVPLQVITDFRKTTFFSPLLEILNTEASIF
jgi:hypothetical protein